MSEPFRLRPMERDSLNEEGYLVRENVVSRDECAAMADAVETMERDLLAAKRRTKETAGMFELQRELGAIVKWEPLLYSYQPAGYPNSLAVARLLAPKPAAA